MKQQLSGNIVDIFNKNIYPGLVDIEDGLIVKITPVKKAESVYLMPGFVDAHVHIESSMLTPIEFARLAVVHGTVGTVSDPHEIGNVLGREGVEYMIDNAAKSPFKIFFGAPSCVPATNFETAGASITLADIEYLFKERDIKYLAEMMNWPGVLQGDEDVYARINLAKKLHKKIDGHAPGLQGEEAIQYIKTGISTDHECFTSAEALNKLKNGMKVLVREGSAAKNFEALHGLLHSYPDQMMFCSDDKHPDELLEGHINQLVKRALAKDIDLFKVLKIASVNPVEHYGLEIGLLREGDHADLIVVDSLVDFNILKTFINGKLVAEQGKSLLPEATSRVVNNFNIGEKTPADFQLKGESEMVRVIEANDGELITHEVEGRIILSEGYAESNTAEDILKIAVLNRYQEHKPAIAFIKNFGLKNGALASSVAHDSHNIIAVGTNDHYLSEAANLIIKEKGGISAVSEQQQMILSLPIAGLMTDQPGTEVAEKYIQIDKMAKNMGSKLKSPFMTLSFMALLVIPELKLSDQGLFNGKSFNFVEIFK